MNSIVTKHVITAIAGAGMIALLGCSNDFVVVHNSESSHFDPSYLSYAAGEGAIYTEILGNPFGVPQDQLEAIVTDVMYGAHFGPVVPFVTTKPEDYKSPYRVVMLFNPALGVNAHRLCESSDQPATGSRDRVRVLAVFCSSRYRESSAVASVGGVRSPMDPGFRQLISQVTQELFPPRDQDIEGSGDDYRS